MKFLYASGSRPLDGYTIKRGIGRGGFGEVYFATSDAGKELALKHVERNLDVELRGVSQCLNLKHANLIDLYDVRYDEQGEAWVVMEYVAGQSLKDAIDRNPNGLPLDEVDSWFRGLAAGTQYLHDYGIVHRDLKPGNVFEDGGIVKIGDYGLSKFISCSRRSGQTESVGTFHYMAPEIGKGNYGKEIDIYALGIILYEMITGRVPFEGESSQEIIMKHLTADPDVSGIPLPYRTIIQRAMQKDPEKRFHNVAEMVALLEPTVRTASVAAAPVGASAVAASSSSREAAATLFIGDDEREMMFGPLRPVVRAGKAGQGAPPPRVVMAPRANGDSASTRREEPIAQAVKTGCGKLSTWWNTGPLATPIKVLLLVAVVALGVTHAGWLIPLAMTLVAVYVVYLGIRMLTEAMHTPQTQTVAAAPAANYRCAGWRNLSTEQQSRTVLGMRTFGDRAAELSGSMLGAAGVAVVLTVMMLVLADVPLTASGYTMTAAAWLWTLITVGAWLVLAAGKFSEHKPAEPIRRRFVMLVLGMLLAVVGFGLQQFLMTDVLVIGSSTLRPAGELDLNDWARGMTGAGGSPLLPGYLAFFAAVFFTVGWWKQSDPLRSSRFAFGTLITTFLIAFAWSAVLPFPEPMGYFLPVAISVAVQLSAPWINKQQRAAMRQRLQEAR